MPLHRSVAAAALRRREALLRRRPPRDPCTASVQENVASASVIRRQCRQATGKRLAGGWACGKACPAGKARANCQEHPWPLEHPAAMPHSKRAWPPNSCDRKSTAPGAHIRAEGACGADSSRAGETEPTWSAAVAQAAEQNGLPGIGQGPAGVARCGVSMSAGCRQPSVALIGTSEPGPHLHPTAPVGDHHRRRSSHFLLVKGPREARSGSDRPAWCCVERELEMATRARTHRWIAIYMQQTEWTRLAWCAACHGPVGNPAAPSARVLRCLQLCLRPPGIYRSQTIRSCSDRAARELSRRSGLYLEVQQQHPTLDIPPSLE